MNGWREQQLRNARTRRARARRARAPGREPLAAHARDHPHVQLPLKRIHAVVSEVQGQELGAELLSVVHLKLVVVPSAYALRGCDPDQLVQPNWEGPVLLQDRPADGGRRHHAANAVERYARPDEIEGRYR